MKSETYSTLPVTQHTDIKTLEDVRNRLKRKDPKHYRLHAFRRLETLLDQVGAPLAMPISQDWIDRNLPPARKSIHPRPDLEINLDRYQRLRSDILGAIAEVSGEKAAKKARRARNDQWRKIREAAKLHTVGGGLVHTSALSGLDNLIDNARRAHLLPTDFEHTDFLERLKAVIPTTKDYLSVRTGLKFLLDFNFIDEISVCLPPCPIPQLPTLRNLVKLPEHIDDYINEMVKKASTEKDEIECADELVIKQKTADRYRAALKYHVSTLPKCEVSAQCGYLSPIKDLQTVQDPSELFTDDHIHATIRHARSIAGTSAALSSRSISAYYGSLLVVMARNGYDIAQLNSAIKNNKFLKQAKAESNGMTPAIRAWCERLLTDELTERRFRNLHRISKAHAQKIISNAKSDGRNLTPNEIVEVRMFGTVAAACAVEYAGRPIRLSNALGLRIAGSTKNFFTPSDKRYRAYGFTLEANETKTCEAYPFTELNAELYGAEVMEWYLTSIRPLFPNAANNFYLFPSIQLENKRISSSHFDTWFKRVATLAGIPMTFHRWRHGYASILMREDEANLRYVADMLNNTPRTVIKNYAFTLKQKTYQKGQKKMVETAQRHNEKLAK